MVRLTDLPEDEARLLRWCAAHRSRGGESP